MADSFRVATLPGDGIGPEILHEAERVLRAVGAASDIHFEFEPCLIGGAALDAGKKPLPGETLDCCNRADAALLGAVGGPAWDDNPAGMRPENGILEIRSALNLYANLRPVRVYAPLADASTLKEPVICGLDLLIVRELTGDVYFGEHVQKESEAYDVMPYHVYEVERIAKVAFDIARSRKKSVCSIDKANILESSRLWRSTVKRVAEEYPDVELTHMFVDNAAMQLLRAPKQFDVMLTGNLFGDILSDEASMLTGSIGMLPSASLGARKLGLYEPIHGSAPDIAGQNAANPLAAILSAAMMLRYSLKREDAATAIEQAVEAVLKSGLRTADIHTHGKPKVSCSGMGDAVIRRIQAGN